MKVCSCFVLVAVLFSFGARAEKPDRFVEYIESNGSQSIDTEVVGKSGTRIESDMAWVSIPNDGAYLAARNGNVRVYPYYCYEGQMLGYGGYENYRTQTIPVAGKKIHVESVLAKGLQRLVVDGVTLVERTDEAEYDTGKNLLLFGSSPNGTSAVRARCYGLKIYLDGELMRDFAPCLADGEGALHDRVSDLVFFPHGNRILTVPIPSDFGTPAKRLEYVETDGTQWIDLGVTARAGTAAKVRMAWMDNNDSVFLGARTDKNASRFFLLCGNNWTPYCGFRDATYRINSSDIPGGSAKGVVHDFETECRADGLTVKVGEAGGEMVTVLDQSGDFDFDTERNLYLFAANYNGTADYGARARLYSFDLWQDRKLVRRLTPVRLTSGLVALWDSVRREVLLPNNGTEMFTAFGPEIGRFTRPRIIIFVR